MTFPKVVYVTASDDCDDEDLLAWRTLASAGEGQIGVYVLEEKLEKREAVEIRKAGTKTWFKPK